MSSFVRRLSGVESYHHLQQRHRLYGGGVAGRAASIQGTLFLADTCESQVDFVTKQILNCTAKKITFHYCCSYILSRFV